MNIDKHKPQLTVIPGQGEQNTSILSALSDRQHRFVTRFLPLVTAVGILGTGVASHEIDNSSRKAKQDSTAAKFEAERKAAVNIDTLHAAGKEYTVTVNTGDGAETILNKNEPAFNTSEAVRAAAIRDIEEQAPEGASSLQSGQTVSVPDLPGGNSAPNTK